MSGCRTFLPDFNLKHINSKMTTMTTKNWSIIFRNLKIWIILIYCVDYWLNIFLSLSLIFKHEWIIFVIYIETKLQALINVNENQYSNILSNFTSAGIRQLKHGANIYNSNCRHNLLLYSYSKVSNKLSSKMLCFPYSFV